jgi:hypothetical protein
MREIPVTYLREVLSYDPGTGDLTWLRRPREYFSSEQSWKAWNAQYAGCVVRGLSSGGYYTLGLRRDGVLFILKAHRVAWAIVTGKWPPDEVDHINGKRADNRLSNLRLATCAEQRQNSALRMDSTSGLLGVSWYRRTGKWRAGIKVRGRYYHLGCFSTRELAYAAYCEAKARLHLFNPVSRAA